MISSTEHYKSQNIGQRLKTTYIYIYIYILIYIYIIYIYIYERYYSRARETYGTKWHLQRRNIDRKRCYFLYFLVERLRVQNAWNVLRVAIKAEQFDRWTNWSFCSYSTNLLGGKIDLWRCKVCYIKFTLNFKKERILLFAWNNINTIYFEHYLNRIDKDSVISGHMHFNDEQNRL